MLVDVGAFNMRLAQASSRHRCIMLKVTLFCAVGAWSLAKLWTNLKKTKKSIFIFEVRHTLSTLMHKPHYAEVQPTPGGA
jgi:uncharacterized Rmd1/YagE family protein